MNLKNVQFNLSKGSEPRRFLQVLVILASLLAPFDSGLMTSRISPSFLFPNATKHDEITTFEEASPYLPLISAFGLAISAYPMSILVDLIGRKKVILAISIPQFLGWFIIAFGTRSTSYYFSRIFVGIADAALYASLPVYIGEIAEPSIRSWSNLVGFSTYLGIFMINLIGFKTNMTKRALICSCFPILHILFFMFVPESPYFLIMKNRKEEAVKAFKTLRWMNNVTREFHVLEADIQRQTSEENSFKELFKVPVHFRALLVCVFAKGAQQFSGLAVFGSCTIEILHQSEKKLPHYLVILLFVIFFIMTVALSIYFVEKFGRRFLMIFSCTGCGLVLSVVTIYFYVREYTSTNTVTFDWIPFVGIICYIVTCAVGLGVLPITFLSELFSASIKSKAILVNSILSAILTALANQSFQLLSCNFGLTVSFAFFTICCFISAVISYHLILETKGKTLEQVQQHIRRKTMCLELPTNTIEITHL